MEVEQRSVRLIWEEVIRLEYGMDSITQSVAFVFNTHCRAWANALNHALRFPSYLQNSPPVKKHLVYVCLSRPGFLFEVPPIRENGN